MITAHDVFADGTLAEAVDERVGDQEVVEAPAAVFRSRVHHVSPEGVGAALVRIEMAERVDHLRLRQHVGESLAFLRRKPGVLFVGFKVFQVDFVVGDVQIAAYDRRLLLVQVLWVYSEKGKGLERFRSGGNCRRRYFTLHATTA